MQDFFVAVGGFSSCGAGAQKLWHVGLADPWQSVSEFPDQGLNLHPLHYMTILNQEISFIYV